MPIKRKFRAWFDSWAPACVAVVLLLNPLAPPVRATISMPSAPKGAIGKKDALPPQAAPATARVKAGGTIQIPLRVYGAASQVRYTVRKDPKLGKVLGIRDLDGGIALLIYQETAPMTGDGDMHDHLSFVAQDRNGTSAPEEIDITIVDDAPVLAFPNAVDFGQMAVGATSTRVITVANRGGRIIEGNFGIEPPWSIEPTHFQLKRGQEARFTLSFLAGLAQEYHGTLRYQGFPERETTLHAQVFAPIVIAPRELDLLASGTDADAPRSGTVTVSNRTGKDTTLRIAAGERLRVPREVIVPANGANTVTMRLDEHDLAGFNETVEFRFDGAIERIDVHAAAVLPTGFWLRAEPKAFDFGKVEVGHPRSMRLRVENHSGVDALVTAEAPPPFQVDRSRFQLAGGQGLDLAVSLQPAWPGRISGLLKLHAPNADVVLPLSANVSSRTYVTGTGPSAAEVTTVTLAGGGVNSSAARASQPLRILSGVRAIGTIALNRVTPGTADISWESPAEPKLAATLKYRIEVRRIGLDRTHSILVDWVPVPTVEFTKEADRVHAHIMEIPPGIGVTLRVVSISARGYESEPSTPMQFFVPRKEAIFTVQRLLLALFALIIVGALWLRNQVNVPMRGE